MVSEKYGILKEYFESLLRHNRLKILFSFVITIFSGFSKGGSFLLLLPLLGLAGVTSSSEQQSKSFELVAMFWDALGISFTLYTSLALYLVLVLLHAVLGYANTILDTEIVESYKQTLRDGLFSAVINAEWKYVKNAKSSHIFNNIIAEVDTLGAIGQIIVSSIGTAVMFVIYLATSLYVSFKMTLVASVCFLPLIVFQKSFNKRAYATGEEMYNRHETLFGAVLEFINSFKLAKSYNLQDRYVSQFEEITRQTAKDNLRFSKISASTRLLYEIGSAVIICVVLIWAIEVIRMPAVDLLLVVYIATKMLPNIASLTRNFQYVLNILPTYIAVTKLLEEARGSREMNPAAKSLAKFPTESITFSNIYFGYEDSPPIFNNFTCNIPINKTTSIVGESGKGKSTLIEMLLGLLKPQAGEILLDDVNLSDINLTDGRSTTAYIPQECFLFHTTIRQNLLWAKPDASEEELHEALQSAAGEFVYQFPKGLETVVGDQGIRLSGGERQRIALARALLRKPKILILDEATNALDCENENLIKNAVDGLRGKSTVIIVSHDQVLDEGADQVVRIA